MPRALLLAASLLFAVSVRASEPVRANSLKPRGACECITKKGCWKIVREAFQENSSGGKTEIEAAVNDRFFPGANAFALRPPFEDGHFLTVQCGGVACGDKRDLLEARFIMSRFLASLPLGMPQSELFDRQTWEITAKGDSIFNQAKLCKTGLLPALVDMVHNGLSK